MLIPYILTFMAGALVAALCIFYGIELIFNKEIRSEKMRRLEEELKTYQKHYEAVSDMNKDYWG